MQSTLEYRDRNWAAIVTVVFHGLLILLLIIITLTVPVPLPSDIPMELELGEGFIDAGGGGGGSSSATAKEVASTPEDFSTPSNITNDAVEENPIEEAPVPPSTKPVNQTKPVNNNTTKPANKTNPNALFNMQQEGNGTGNGNGDGNGNGTGNGNGNGSGNGNGDGNGDGTGPGTKPGVYGRGDYLAGRLLKYKPTVTESIHEEGRVVINIYVNQQGNVTRVSVNEKNTNTASKHLRELAMAAARKATWNEKSDAPIEQVGTLEFNFKF